MALAPRLAVVAILLHGSACGARSGLDVSAEGADAGGDAAADAPDAPDGDAWPPLPRCAFDFDETPSLVSVTPEGAPSVGGAGSPTISGDGRFVAFVSSAGDLVADDHNDELDVFVRDRLEGLTLRASVSSEGVEGDDASGFRLISGRPSLSDDGSLVAFPSNSDRLHLDDDNSRTDVYVHSLRTRETRFVRFADDRFVGGDAPVLSGDGRFVAFAMLQIAWEPEDEIAAFQIVRVSLETGVGELLSVDPEGRLGDQLDDGLSTGVPLTQRVLAITEDGGAVAFASGSGNLDPTEDRHPDVFVRDVDRGVLEEASGGADDESLGPSLSADGRFVAFFSGASTFPDEETQVYVRDRTRDAIEPIPRAAGYPVLSADGRFVVFGWERRSFVYDRSTGARAEVQPGELSDDDIQTQPYLSRDGCWVTHLFSRGSDTQVWVAKNPLR